MKFRTDYCTDIEFVKFKQQHPEIDINVLTLDVYKQYTKLCVEHTLVSMKITKEFLKLNLVTKRDSLDILVMHSSFAEHLQELLNQVFGNKEIKIKEWLLSSILKICTVAMQTLLSNFCSNKEYMSLIKVHHYDVKRYFANFLQAVPNAYTKMQLNV